MYGNQTTRALELLCKVMEPLQASHIIHFVVAIDHCMHHENQATPTFESAATRLSLISETQRLQYKFLRIHHTILVSALPSTLYYRHS